MLQDRLHQSLCGVARSDLHGITGTAHAAPLEPEHIQLILLEIACQWILQLNVKMSQAQSMAQPIPPAHCEDLFTTFAQTHSPYAYRSVTAAAPSYGSDFASRFSMTPR